MADTRTRRSADGPWRHGLAPVGGLLNLMTHERFRFDDIRLGDAPKRYYAIGRAEGCDIVLRDQRVSSVHAFVERLDDDTFLLRDNESRNGIYVFRGGHGEAVATTLLTVGLVIGIGGEAMVTITQDGRTPLTAFTATEFDREAYRVYGTLRAAGEAIGKSHQTIARALARLRKRRAAEQRHE